MRLRTVLILVLLTSSGALDAFVGKPEGVAMHQRAQEQRSSVIDCTIQTSQLNWRHNEEATVSVQIRVQGVSEITALPSLLLTTVQKTSEPIQGAYWAPFDITTGSSTKKSQKMQSTGETNPRSLRLVPSRLLWARTISSVWPSQTLTKTVPPGKYRLQVQFELEAGKTVSSNELEISITK